jgi:tetratricopeptide (TPR) repeat protein
VLFPTSANAAQPVQAAEIFLSGLEISQPARFALVEKISDGGDGPFVVESGASVYSLAVGKARSDRDEDVRRELEAMEGRVQVLSARRALVMHIMKERVDRKRYSDDDALGNALDSIFVGRIQGAQSASDIVDGWAISLVWLSPETANAVRSAFPPEDDLHNGYNEFLYERAKRMFDAGRYNDALPIFKHIHDLKWANVGLYLDASECFLRVGDAGEARKLLAELIETLAPEMGSDDLARAGRLFREAGDRGAALIAFQTARLRLREGK